MQFRALSNGQNFFSRVLRELYRELPTRMLFRLYIESAMAVDAARVAEDRHHLAKCFDGFDLLPDRKRARTHR